MKREKLCHSLLTLFRLVSLLVYVLACTAFSPDDRKVLYTSLDPNSGLVGISVFDRESGKSELMLVPGEVSDGQSTARPLMVRSQWIHEGKDVLVGWVMKNDRDDLLHLAIVPYGRKGPIRFFAISAREAATRLAMPLAVAGSYLFYSAQTNQLARLNLDSGQIVYNPGWDNESYVLPGRSGQAPSYGTATEMGALDPETFARSKMFVLSEAEQNETEKQLVLPLEDGARAFVIGREKPVSLILFEPGKPRRVVPLAGAVKPHEKLGLLAHSSSQNRVYAPFLSPAPDKQGSRLGILEIPLDGSLPTRTVLLETKAELDEQDLSFFFQPSISNDGKTLAVATTYLSHRDRFDPADCALYFMDLGSPNRSIKKVVIPAGAKNLLWDF